MSVLPEQFRKKIHKSIRRRRIKVLQLYGAATSQGRACPDFIIIGSQRSGTTSLYNYLAGHPDILPAIVKEVHYFDLAFHKGMNWYRGHFPAIPNHPSGPKKITGEASPYYIYHPYAPIRIANAFPAIKIILLLRNPVDRAFSHYQHEVSLGFENLSFAQAIEQESSRLSGEIEKMVVDETYTSFNHQHYSYVSRGVYIDQIRHWMNYFPREQLQIIKSEDFFASPQKIYSQVVEFLNLPEWGLANVKVHNRLQYSGMGADMKSRLNNYFKPFNSGLYDYLGRDFAWSSD